MKFSKEELFELTEESGGRFACPRDEAYNFCRRLALSHYENFPVGSVLLPQAQRPYIFAVYAFARIADDIADELTDIDESIRIEALNKMASLIDSTSFYSIEKGNPVFLALHRTMKKLSLPSEPFLKLLEAFRRDINFKKPETWDDVLDYCRHSANPVGELLLRIFGRYNARTATLSDKICTALQLVNFWQDLSVDLPGGRCYIPEEVLKLNGMTEENLHEEKKSGKLRVSLDVLYDYSRRLFEDGSELIRLLKPLRLRLEIAATIEGGKEILKKTESLGTKIIEQRPELGKADFLKIFIRAFTKI